MNYLMIQDYFFKEYNTVSALKVLAVWQGDRLMTRLVIYTVVKSPDEVLTRALFLSTLARGCQKLILSILW